MKFVVAGGPRRSPVETTKQRSSPPPPAKYVLESRLSKSPEGQQVLQTLSTARSHVMEGAPSADINRSNTASSKSSGGKGDETVTTSASDDEETKQPPQKESFFRRIASCATDAKAACVAPTTASQPSSDEHDDGSQVPMAHLQFLRTNPTIARVTDAASRRYPALCGRPDTIFEEPDEQDSKASSKRRFSNKSYDISRSKSGDSSSYDGSKTYATLSTFEKTAVTNTVTSGGSLGSGGSGDNTTFLDNLALQSAVASKDSRKLGKTAFVSSLAASHEPSHEKDAIGNVSFQKKETAKQVHLLAAEKVEAMMELQDADSEDQCEI